MKKKLIILSYMLLIILSLSISADVQPPIGYEYINGFLHTWNQNPMGINESHIWQNISSNYEQFYNGENLETARDRSTWLKNVFGVIYKFEDNYFWFDDYITDQYMIIESDNSSYWNQSIYSCGRRQGRDICAGWIRGQELTSMYMENSFSWWVSNSINFPHTLKYAWKFDDINIENNDDVDIARYCYNEAEQVHENYTLVRNICEDLELNSTTTFERENLNRFDIIDKNSEQGHYIRWGEETKIDLSYLGDGSPILLSDIEDIDTQDKVEMYWIDATGCTEGQPEAGIHQSILCPLNSEGYSGFINFSFNPFGSDNTTSVHRDAQPIVGAFPLGAFQRTWEKQGFFCFNVSKSGIPKQAHSFNVSVWTGEAVTQDTANKPSDWRTRFKTAHISITDDSNLTTTGDTGLDVNDTGVGNSSHLINWDDPFAINHDSCPPFSNTPCETWVYLTKNASSTSAFKDFNFSLQNTGDLKEIFCVAQEDESQFIANQKWQWIFDITSAPADGTPRFHLNISFGLPESGFNVNLSTPQNNSIFYIKDPGININFTVNSSGDYYTDFCDFDINGTVTRNNTNVANGTMGIVKSLTGVGKYTWNVSCQDQFGFTNYTDIWNFTIEKPTSIKAVIQDIDSFTVDTDVYEEKAEINFNASENTNLTIFNTMNIIKLTGGGTNVVTVRFNLNGTQIYEEDLRSVSIINDEGSSGLHPINFNVSQGGWVLTMDYKRSGSGNIEVNDIDFILQQFESVHHNQIRQTKNDFIFTFDGMAEEEGFNWTVPKTIESASYYFVEMEINKSNPTSAVVTSFIRNLNESDEESPRWLRYLSDDDDKGSVAGLWVEDDEDFIHDHSIVSSQDDNAPNTEVTINGSVIDFDMRDNLSYPIEHFFTTNDTANTSNTYTLSAGTYIINNFTKKIKNGSGYFLSGVVSFDSNTGVQTPTVFINSTTVDNSTCYTKKERRLSSNSDIGNVYMHTICEQLTEGETYTFLMGITVPTGNTIEVYDEAFNGYEVSPFDISTIFPIEEITPSVSRYWQVAILGGLIATALLFIFVSCRFDKKKHYIFKIFLVFIGVFLIFISLNVGVTIAGMENSTVQTLLETSYGAWRWVLWVLLGAFCIGSIMYGVKRLNRPKEA